MGGGNCELKRHHTKGEYFQPAGINNATSRNRLLRRCHPHSLDLPLGFVRFTLCIDLEPAFVCI